jgi:hypothetical protein
MWANKKSHTPQAADPKPKNWQTNQPPQPTLASWEGTTKMDNDVLRPAGATAWLGSSLRVKGEISGNEDLYIDGIVEGLVHLVEGKLTVGATAKRVAISRMRNQSNEGRPRHPNPELPRRADAPSHRGHTIVTCVVPPNASEPGNQRP